MVLITQKNSSTSKRKQKYRSKSGDNVQLRECHNYFQEHMPMNLREKKKALLIVTTDNVHNKKISTTVKS